MGDGDSPINTEQDEADTSAHLISVSINNQINGQRNGSGTGNTNKAALDITIPGTGITVRNVLKGTSAVVVVILILLVVLAVATVIIVRELKE